MWNFRLAVRTRSINRDSVGSLFFRGIPRCARGQGPIFFPETIRTPPFYFNFVGDYVCLGIPRATASRSTTSSKKFGDRRRSLANWGNLTPTLGDSEYSISTAPLFEGTKTNESPSRDRADAEARAPGQSCPLCPVTSDGN